MLLHSIDLQSNYLLLIIGSAGVRNVINIQEVYMATRSCIINISTVCEYICENLPKRLKTDGIYVDFPKVFGQLDPYLNYPDLVDWLKVICLS